MNAPLKAVILDLDGTLLDTVPDLAVAVNAVRAGFNLPPLLQERIASFVGKGAQVLMHRALTNSLNGEIDASLLAQAMASFNFHYARENGRQAKLYAGVIEGLALFEERGIKMACVTNKPFDFANALLVEKKLLRYFPVLLGGDSLSEKKPHPAPMLEACRRLSAPPENTVAIGDSINDVLAAKAAGIRSFVVPYGYTEGQPLESFAGNAIVASIHEAATTMLSV